MKCPSQFFMHTYDSTTNILPLDGLGPIQVWVQKQFSSKHMPFRQSTGRP